MINNLLHFGLGHPANAIGSKIGVPGLNTSQTAQILITLFLPLGYQTGIGNVLFQTVIVQLCQKKER